MITKEEKDSIYARTGGKFKMKCLVDKNNKPIYIDIPYEEFEMMDKIAQSGFQTGLRFRQAFLKSKEDENN